MISFEHYNKLAKCNFENAWKTFVCKHQKVNVSFKFFKSNHCNSYKNVV